MTLWAIPLRIDFVSFAFGERFFSIYGTLSVAQFGSLFNVGTREFRIVRVFHVQWFKDCCLSP